MEPTCIDEQLWRAVQQDDEEAFKILFVRYYTPLCEYAAHFLPIEPAVEELVADVFLKLWHKRTSLRITASLKAYLYKMVKHQVLGYLRMVKDTSFLPLDENQWQTPATEMNPFQQLSHQEFLQDLEQSIKQLPEQRQRIFRLNKLDGLSYSEIAQRLNLSEKTVKNQVFRAVQYLRQTDVALCFMLLLLNISLT